MEGRFYFMIPLHIVEMTLRKYKIVENDSKEIENKVNPLQFGSKWVKIISRQDMFMDFWTTESRWIVGKPPSPRRGRDW